VNFSQKIFKCKQNSVISHGNLFKPFFDTVNNKDFTTELSRKTGYASKDAAGMIENLIQVMTDQWQRNDILSIQNFGTFEVKKKLERISVNPVTKQRMLVPPKLVLTFRPSNIMKDKFK